MTSPSPYRRLPGRGIHLDPIIAIPWERTSLWMGDDHLLEINHGLYVENYRRFYYRDIRWIALSPTSSGKNIMRVFLLVALILLVIPLVSALLSAPWIVIVICSGPSVLASIPVFHCLVRGTTCRTTLATAVQRVELRSLHRVGAATRALTLLREKIEAAQTDLLLPQDAGIPPQDTIRTSADSSPGNATPTTQVVDTP